MKTIFLSVALATSALALPAAAQAQARPAVIIIDTDRVLSECTACKSAASQLDQRRTALRTRAQTLQQQLEAEGKPLQAQFEALKGKEPDAALKAKITAFQAKERAANQELANTQRTLESTAANVNQQIGARLLAVVEQIRARRGATIAISKNSTIANDSTADVTTEVLTALNQQLPAVSVTPLPQQQTPQGR